MELGQFMLRYFLWFFVLCFVLTCICGVIAALLPQGVGGILTAVPYLIAMLVVLFQFIKRERRAPTQSERKKFSLGFSAIFWGYNLAFVLLGVWWFSRQSAEIWQNLLQYLQQPQFISLIIIMFCLIAIPLYLMTYWFYGPQARRMADKMLQAKP